MNKCALFIFHLVFCFCSLQAQFRCDECYLVNSTFTHTDKESECPILSLSNSSWKITAKTNNFTRNTLGISLESSVCRIKWNILKSMFDRIRACFPKSSQIQVYHMLSNHKYPEDNIREDLAS